MPAAAVAGLRDPRAHSATAEATTAPSTLDS
jgi:hypothetical protein